MNHIAIRVAHIAILTVQAGLLTAWAPRSASAQESPEPAVVALSPCGSGCGLTLIPVVEFGEDTGPGMIEGYVNGRVDSSGRMYLFSPGADHVLVFDTDGSFLRRVGRGGEGPGELLNPRSFAVLDDGVFAVLDGGRGVILTFDWTGRLLGEVRTSNWIPTGTGIWTVPLGGARAVYQANFRGGDRAGYPLHLINLESGAIDASFGSRMGVVDVDRERRLNVVPARGPGESIWMARQRAYQIELWEPNNRLVLAMRRDVDWFPEALVDLDNPHDGRRRAPESVVASIEADDARLWVLIGRADDRWAEAADDDDLMTYDTVVEVIDWRRGRVVASRRFDEPYYSSWIGPGLLGELVITSDGSVRYRMLRVALEGPGD